MTAKGKSMILGSQGRPTEVNAIMDIWGQTDPGRQRNGHNEDYIWPNGNGTPLGNGAYLMVIADGVGGAEIGEVASRLVVDSINAFFATITSITDPRALLEQVTKEANRQLYNYVLSQPNVRQAGCTLVLALVHGNQLYTSHVGDSRIYLFRNGKVQWVTKDHSLTQQKIDAKLISEKQAKTDDDRNIITRSMGAGHDVQVDLNGPIPLKPSDVVLLCSDGLSDVVPDNQLGNAVYRSMPDHAVPRLIAKANQAGGPDNISVVIGRVQGDMPDMLPPIALGIMALLFGLAVLGVIGGLTLTLLSPPTPATSDVATFESTAVYAAATATPLPEVIIPTPVVVTTTNPNQPVETPLPAPQTPANQATAFATSTPLPTLTPALIPPLLPPTPRPTPSEGGNITPPTPTSPPLQVQSMSTPETMEPNLDTIIQEGIGGSFKWRWDGILLPNQGFEIRIWQGDEEHYGAYGAADLNKIIQKDKTNYTVGIRVESAYSIQQHGPGKYKWTVAVVQLEPYQRIGPEGPDLTFTYAKAGGSSDSKDKSDGGGGLQTN